MAQPNLNMTLDEIIAWCQENKQVDWLKATAAKKTPYKVYPKVDGKPDKTQEPKIEMRPISFIQLKQEFLEEFGLKPPKKEKSLTMYEKISML